MAAKIFRINYKSDFILTLTSDAGWMTPFCIKFWTGSPMLAYYASWDGETYTHCAPVAGEPTKLLVQFDDHHLPIGDLKFQIAYHFTVADFPNDTEDEVMNQANITTEIDGQTYQVMLDFNGETAPEIQFSLPAYENEEQRIANEEQRIANEQTRIDNEALRISAEQTRQDNESQRIRNEQTRINQEEARVREFATLKNESEAATTAANNAATLANQKAQLAADKAQLAADKAALAQDAADLANQKAQLAADKAALADDAAALANQKAALAQQKAEYAKDQGDYAKQQGDYAKSQADLIPADVMRTALDATFVNANNEALFYMRQADATLAGLMTSAEHKKLTALPAAADLETGIIYDVSALHPTSGVSGGSTYASLSAALAIIPQGKRKGGMSVKFVQSSDNKYVEYLYKVTDAATTATFTNVANWEKLNLEEEVGQLGKEVDGNFVKDITWTRGYINRTGTIMNSTASVFSQPFVLKAGQKVTIGTRNTNICIIGSTLADSLSVGDSVSVIQLTSGIDQFETYSYTAQQDIKIVLCVLKSEYSLSFYDSNNLSEKLLLVEQKADTALDDAQTATQKANNVDAAVFTEVAENLTDYISDINGSFIRASNHTIETNQYTGSYRLYLFRLSAGKYVFETTGNSPASVDVIGIISSIEDFRVGGVLSESILVGSPATSVERTFNEETLVVLSGWYDRINYSGFVKRINKESNFNILEERIDSIEEQISPSLKLTIPDVVYAMVGTEVNIWNDAVSLSIDKGLFSPVNYHIRWQCNKGIITDRCFRFIPVAGDVGNVSCTCFLYDMRGNLVDSKTFTIKVLSQNALQSAKNIAYFGDSLGASAATALYSDFHDANKYGGVAPLMCGTRGTTPKYEAVGGYEWSDYATEGRTAYRASVTGVTSISLGAIYTDGVANFAVIEVNITDGSGNILLQSHYTHHGVLIMPSGTLTKVSGGGDDTVPYTNAFAESANPLWNDSTQELDVNQFKQMVGLQQSDKFDAVSFQFGVNEAARSNLDDILTHIDSLYHCFVDDNPNCKFIIGLNTTSGNDVNGAGNNYGASFNTISYLENSYNIRQLYLTLQNNADYPNIRIAPIGLEVDRYYGYAFSTRQISQRYAEDEQYHNNYVHPGACGYGQMGDAYFATYIGVLTE